MHEFGEEDRVSKMGSTTGKKNRSEVTSVQPVQSRRLVAVNSSKKQDNNKLQQMKKFYPEEYFRRAGYDYNPYSSKE